MSSTSMELRIIDSNRTRQQTEMRRIANKQDEQANNDVARREAEVVSRNAERAAAYDRPKQHAPKPTELMPPPMAMPALYTASGLSASAFFPGEIRRPLRAVA